MDSKFVRAKGVIRKIGGSYIVVVNKQVREQLLLEAGDVVNFKLWKVEMADITCPTCKYTFVDEKDKDPYDCPDCGEEFLQVTNPESQGTERRDE